MSLELHVIPHFLSLEVGLRCLHLIFMVVLDRVSHLKLDCVTWRRVSDMYTYICLYEILENWLGVHLKHYLQL